MRRSEDHLGLRSDAAALCGLLIRFASFAAVIVGGPWVFWVTVRPAEAPNARQAVAWAEKDPIWSMPPEGFTQTSSYRHFAEADWVPAWPSDEETRSSSVGTWFKPALATVDDVAAWRSAAEAAGWTYRACSPLGEGPPSLTFSKPDSPLGATLVIENTRVQGLLVRVTVPAKASADVAGAVDAPMRCRSEDPTTWEVQSVEVPLPTEPEPLTPEDPAAARPGGFGAPSAEAPTA